MADGSVDVKNETMDWPIEVTLLTAACHADDRNDVNDAHHCCPVLVCVRNNANAATAAAMAVMTSPNGLAFTTAVNATCTAVAAFVTADHAVCAAVTIFSPPAISFNAGTMPPNCIIRSTVLETPVAAVVSVCAPVVTADIAVDTPFSPAETMSQPLTASNAMVMAFNAPDTSAPFC